MTDISATQVLAQLRSMAAAVGGGPAEADRGANQANFSELFLNAVKQVNASQNDVQNLRDGFQQGDPGIDISQVMIASQKANVEFQLLMQVRNRLVNAYQEIMNMQI